MSSPLGEDLSRIVDLDFALRAGFTITLDDIAADDFAALQILHAERDKIQGEKLKQ